MEQEPDAAASAESRSPSQNCARRRKMVKHQRFSQAEDIILLRIVAEIGSSDWNTVAQYFPGRTVRQVRDRWHYYLSPASKQRDWSPQEDATLLRLVSVFGKKWSKISHYIPGRTNVSIRNRVCQLDKTILSRFDAGKASKSERSAQNDEELQKDGQKVTLPSCSLLPFQSHYQAFENLLTQRA